MLHHQTAPPDDGHRCPQPARTSGPAHTSSAVATVLGNADMVAVILGHAELGPAAFVAIGRVAKAWHTVCRADAALLLAAARKPDFLTKRTLTGLFALHWHEADKLPRGKRARRNGGFLYMYGDAAIDHALTLVGGLAGWQRRIAARARSEAASVRPTERAE